ncbi:MAG: tyrosine decarboxylase MfnA [Promethearchaeota archaeon]
MLEYGLEKKEILRLLEKKLEIDLTYQSGSILGSMNTEPLDFGKELYHKFVSKNLGDPGLFLGTAKLEEEIVKEIGELFEGKDIIGTFTTGGSEANLIAMRIAKKLNPKIKHPEVVVPVSAHISFDKAADLLDIKLRKARLHKDYTLDLDHYKSLINKKTCGIVGVAGTTSLGLVDPIKEIGEYIESLKNNRIFFHIDAAFGGFVLPFLKRLSYEIPSWDFSVESVDSITADPHKMGLGVIPSGGFFIRDSSILQKTGFQIPYLAGGNFKHFQIVGTRAGGPIIAFWGIMKMLGINGFKKIVKSCMDNTEFLSRRISEIKGLKLASKTTMNIVGITTESGKSICEIDTELRKKDWMLGKFEEFNLIRIVVMPHVEREHLSHFLDDLEIIVKKLNI